VVSHFLDYNFGISFISEIELLAYRNITKAEEIKLKQLISDCFYMDWNHKIKDKTIEIKRNYSIKLPDAIIASTAIVYGIPLITADKGFQRMEELELILLEI